MVISGSNASSKNLERTIMKWRFWCFWCFWKPHFPRKPKTSKHQIQIWLAYRLRCIRLCELCGYWSKPWHLVNPKIAGKWMFIPLELIIIGFDPPPCEAVPTVGSNPPWPPSNSSGAMRSERSCGAHPVLCRGIDRKGFLAMREVPRRMS